jgi:hypothetical protein
VAQPSLACPKVDLLVKGIDRGPTQPELVLRKPVIKPVSRTYPLTGL